MKTVGKSKILIVLILLLAAVLVYFILNKSKFLGNGDKISENARIYTDESVQEKRNTLVEDFPKIPVYPGMKVDRSYKKQQNGKLEYTATWVYAGVNDDAITIIKWYVDEFKKAGWKVEGPYMVEGENELSINVENATYKLTLLNSEQYPGEYGVTQGEQKIILVDIVEK